MRELRQVQSEQGNLVFCGYTESLNQNPGLPKIYVVKTSLNPCTIFNQVVIGKFAGSDLDLKEFAMDLEEVPVDSLYDAKVVKGDLVLTGGAQPAPSGALTFGLETILLPIRGDSLFPIANTGTWFGDMVTPNIGPSDEVGETVHFSGPLTNWVDGGFIICGYTDGQLDQANNGADPRDIHLIKTDIRGNDNWCSNRYDPDSMIVTWADSCRDPNTTGPLDTVSHSSSQTRYYPHDWICDPTGPGSRPESQPRTKRVTNVEGIERDNPYQDFAIAPVPNPIRAGVITHIPSGKFREARIQIEIVDALGRVVSIQVVPIPAGTDRIPLVTTSLLPGVYTIVAIDGDRRGSGRLVVTQ